MQISLVIAHKTLGQGSQTYERATYSMRKKRDDR